MIVRIVATLLILISVIPLFIVFYKLDLHWAMVWRNEAIAWEGIFSIFAFISLAYVVKNRKDHSLLLAFVAVLTFVIVFVPAHDFIKVGIGASSKEDVEQLQLIQFWSSHWW